MMYSESRQFRREQARLRLDSQAIDLVPLDSALRNIPVIDSSISSSPSKTPVSMVQEIAAKRHGHLQFNVIEAVVLPVHRHTVRLTFTHRTGVIIGTGTAQTIQEAKHKSAQDVINQLTNNQNSLNDSTVDYSDSANSSSSSLSQNTSLSDSFSSARSTQSLSNSPVSFDSSGQFISELNVLSQKRRYNPATYDFSRTGPAHLPVFTAICCLDKYTVQAQGSSKKEAKNSAAERMVKHMTCLRL